MPRYAVAVLLAAAAGVVAFIVWPRKTDQNSGAPTTPQVGTSKPGKAWSPGSVIGETLRVISGDKATGDRAQGAVAGKVQQGMASIDNARKEAGQALTSWLAGVLK